MISWGKGVHQGLQQDCCSAIPLKFGSVGQCAPGERVAKSVICENLNHCCGQLCVILHNEPGHIVRGGGTVAVVCCDNTRRAARSSLCNSHSPTFGM